MQSSIFLATLLMSCNMYILAIITKIKINLTIFNNLQQGRVTLGITGITLITSVILIIIIITNIIIIIIIVVVVVLMCINAMMMMMMMMTITLWMQNIINTIYQLTQRNVPTKVRIKKSEKAVKQVILHGRQYRW